MFADDTNIFVQGRDLLQSEDEMNAEVAKIVYWLNANALSLNVNKTHSLILPIPVITY